MYFHVFCCCFCIYCHKFSYFHANIRLFRNPHRLSLFSVNILACNAYFESTDIFVSGLLDCCAQHWPHCWQETMGVGPPGSVALLKKWSSLDGSSLVQRERHIIRVIQERLWNGVSLTAASCSLVRYSLTGLYVTRHPALGLPLIEFHICSSKGFLLLATDVKDSGKWKSLFQMLKNPTYLTRTVFS